MQEGFGPTVLNPSHAQSAHHFALHMIEMCSYFFVKDLVFSIQDNISIYHVQLMKWLLSQIWSGILQHENSLLTFEFTIDINQGISFLLFAGEPLYILMTEVQKPSRISKEYFSENVIINNSSGYF